MMDFWSVLSSCQFGYMKMLQFREFFGQQTWSDPFSHFSLLKFVGCCCFSHAAWKTILGNIFHTENWETSPLSVASIWFHPAFVLICEVSHSITLGHVWFTASCDHSAVFFLGSYPSFPMRSRSVATCRRGRCWKRRKPWGWKNQARHDCMIKKLHESCGDDWGQIL